MTFDVLVDNFTNIMKGVVGSKPNSSSLVQIGVNQFSCFLDEFIKSRYLLYSSSLWSMCIELCLLCRNQQDLVKKLADVKVCPMFTTSVAVSIKYWPKSKLSWQHSDYSLHDIAKEIKEEEKCSCSTYGQTSQGAQVRG